MDVILSGYTLDADLVEDLKKGLISQNMFVTPETISAAYARISRYPQPVTELRKQARMDLESSRQSNRIIVFGMGHHSVAEHVQMSFDIMGISRLALEALESSRLCSYTEKSQRYITFQGDYVIPQEFDEEEKVILARTVEKQVELYKSSLEELIKYQKSLHPEMNKKKRDIETVEGWAKEDARYILPLCTITQLGFSANARNIEYIIRKLRYHKLQEVRQLSNKIYEAASKIAPSLIILSDPQKFKETFGREVSDEYFKQNEKHMEQLCKNIVKENPVKNASPSENISIGNVRLIEYTREPDIKLCAALLFQSGGLNSYSLCYNMAQELQNSKPETFRKVITEAMRFLSEYDPVSREFETISFVFEIVLSASCFAQLKRHRLMTILKQLYDPSLGLTLPPSVIETGLKSKFEEVAKLTEDAYEKVAKKKLQVAQYLLTNAHRTRVLVICNLRELYHIARLRMDPHAQWDIRNTAENMVELAKKVAPVSASLACGKDIFKMRKTEVIEGISKQYDQNENCGLKYKEVTEKDDGK